MERSFIGLRDADWGQETHTRKSITGSVFIFSGGALSGQRKQHRIVAQSSVQCEYVALVPTFREALWLKTFGRFIPSCPIFVDLDIWKANMGCISLAEYDQMTDRSKHIDLKFQFVRYHLQERP